MRPPCLPACLASSPPRPRLGADSPLSPASLPAAPVATATRSNTLFSYFAAPGASYAAALARCNRLGGSLSSVLNDAAWTVVSGSLASR